MSQLKNHSSLVFAAPLVIPAIGVIIIVLSSGDIEGKSIGYLVGFGVISYVGFLLLGYPIARILDKYDYLSISTLLLSGFICGAFLLLIIVGVGPAHVSYSASAVGGLFAFGSLGMLVALTFGLVARVRWFRSSIKVT